MSRFRDTVLRVKNRCKINNVYDCARPILVLAGLLGVGGTRIRDSEGVYTVRNSAFSLLVFTIVSLVYTPIILSRALVHVFTVPDPPRPLWLNIGLVIYIGILFLTLSTIAVGCLRTHVYCERLETMFQIINNIDSQLKQANIRVQHWKITLKVMLLTLVTANYSDLVLQVQNIKRIPEIVFMFSIHLLYMWTILFLLIIHERFLGLNKLLQENATATRIQIVGAGEPHSHGNYDLLRRISLARHVHEQLTHVVQLFSDTCRYVIIGLIVIPIIVTQFRLLDILTLPEIHAVYTLSVCIQVMRIVALISICQANKAERRVLTARLRHLIAFETDREIIRQLQEYIMYNAYSTPGLIDFQFTDIDNVLLLTIINVIVSNALIIYSYTRQGYGVGKKQY